jgi:DNA-binding transcriptional ArsR family regulator
MTDRITLANQELVRVLQAMSDPQRLQVLKLLADGDWHPCGPEVWATGVHKSTVSHHIRILRDAGLLESRLVGRSKHARLLREAVDRRFPGLLDSVLPHA